MDRYRRADDYPPSPRYDGSLAVLIAEVRAIVADGAGALGTVVLIDAEGREVTS